MAYELDPNLYVTFRTVYTFLDWLGDIGGLMSILIDVGGIIMMFIIGNGIKYMLIKEVFKEEGEDHGVGGNSKHESN